MTVKQLRERLADLPDNMEVFIAERNSAFAYGYLETAQVKKISFSESPGGKSLCKDEVLVLEDI